MKLTRIVFCLMLLGGGLASCIREDFSDCYSTNTLLLSYKGDGTTEIFNDKICRVDMYIFDAENKCVNSVELSKQQVENRTATLPPLPAGDYRIICLGNTHQTQVGNLDSGDFSQMQIASTAYFARDEISGNDSLYYATCNYTVRPFTGMGDDDNEQTIEFASSHYDLLVEVAGVPVADPESWPAFTASGVAPVTDFENNVTEETADYLLDTQYDPENRLLRAEANIMRHENHDNVNIRLQTTRAGDTLVEVNLGEFLAANPIIDCTKHEVLIPIRIEFKSGDIVVTVPEWYVEQIKPEF